MDLKLESVSDVVSKIEKKAVSLDQALDVVGLGWYNIKYCLVLAMFLISSIIEVIGYSYVLPSARCDLNMTSAQRGVISSLPYVAIVLTSFMWGFLVDTKGRKRVVVLSSTVGGTLGVIAALMPELVSFTTLKFIASIAMTCPSAVPYAYIGEILPRKHRDLALSVTNALQMMGAGLVPLLAWGILPLGFRVDFGAYEFRSWRLLSMVFSSSFLLSAFFMSFGYESPKYLVSQGKHDEALDVLRNMYAINKRKSPNDFPVHKLIMPAEVEKPKNFLASLSPQVTPLLKPPFLKWLSLNGVLLFGIMTSINGLFMWVPDILNRVFSSTSQNNNMTACQFIRQGQEQVVDNSVCNDTIDEITFIVCSISNVSGALITLAISATINIVGKKAIVIFMFLLIGLCCISVNFTTIAILFSILLVSVQMLAVGLGPINAFAVEIFPTNLRGMAVSLTMSIGRLGSVVGTNVAGALIYSSCEATFYTFGGFLLLCGLLSFLLPSRKSTIS